MNKIEEMLNKQVANLSVLYTKLHHYHWYVKGESFLSLHAKFEELYNKVTEMYDDAAERILIIGGKPITSLKEYLAITSLAEANETDNIKMIQSIIKDFKLLIGEFREIIEVSDQINDIGTNDLLTGFISDLEKEIWILGSLLK